MSSKLGSARRPPRRSISLGVKREVLRRLEAGERQVDVGSAFNLSTSTLRGILKSGNKIKECIETSGLSVTKVICPKSVLLVKMESILIRWMKQIQQDVSLNQIQIRDKARDIFKQLQAESHDVPQSFTASSGWFKRFRLRCRPLNTYNFEEGDHICSEDIKIEQEFQTIDPKFEESTSPIQKICRVCATECSLPLEIYGQDGTDIELAVKINTYLPITVFPEDTLPLFICHNCHSSLLSWHELVERCTKASKHLENAKYEFVDPLVTKDAGCEIGEDQTGIEFVGVNGACTTEVSEMNTWDPISDRHGVGADTTTRAHTNVLQINDSTEDSPLFQNELTTFRTTSEKSLTENMQDQEEDIGDDLSESDTNVVANGVENTIDRISNKVDITVENLSKLELFVCQVCDKQFTQRGALRKHEYIHLPEAPFQCEHCGRCFKKKDSLSKHVMIHTGEKPHACDVCGRCFRVRAILAKHMSTHSGKMLSCQDCGKSYKSDMSFKLHMNEMHNFK